MSSIPQLKNKLKSARTTSKMSKAMKAVSAAKFARLSSIRRAYSQYADEFRSLYGIQMYSKNTSTVKTDTVLVLGSNIGFCGHFNTETCLYFETNVLNSGRPANLIVCGGKMIRTLSDHGLTPDYSFIFSDIPTFKECEELFRLLKKLAGSRRSYPIRVVRPMYRNTLIQIPGSEIMILNPELSRLNTSSMLFLPDAATVLSDLPDKAFHALLFSAVLDTALGAQAATLISMRSAYDNAAEYINTLEKQIHRQRQNEVTSDVIEISSERTGKGDEENV